MKQYFLLEVDVGSGHYTVQDIMEMVDEDIGFGYGNVGVADGYELPEDVAKAVMASVDNRFQEVS